VVRRVQWLRSTHERPGRRGISAPAEVTGRSLKAGLKWAGKIGARAAVIVGETELTEGAAIVRDLDRGEQEKVKLAEVPEYVVGLLQNNE